MRFKAKLLKRRREKEAKGLFKSNAIYLLSLIKESYAKDSSEGKRLPVPVELESVPEFWEMFEKHHYETFLSNKSGTKVRIYHRGQGLEDFPYQWQINYIL